MVNYAEFKGDFSLSQWKKSFEKQLGVCLVGSAGKDILGRGNHKYKNQGLNPGRLSHQPWHGCSCTEGPFWMH